MCVSLFVYESGKILNEILTAVKKTQKATCVNTEEINGLRTETHETREIVDFLKNQMVNRDELRETLAAFKSEIISHVDGFLVLHQKLETELIAMRAKYDRLESYIQ